MKLIFYSLAALIALSGAPLAAQEAQGNLATRAQQIEVAAEARADGDYDRARQILVALLATSPDDPDLLRRLAMVEGGDGRMNVALDQINNAARLAPRDLDIALARAYILNWRGDFAEAQIAVAAIAARDPDYPELAGLQLALERQNNQRELRLRSFSIGSGQSDISLANGTSQTWSNQTLVGALDVSRQGTVMLALMREERSTTDTRLKARVDQRIGDGFIYLAATTVPNPDFLERWSVAAGGELVASEGMSALVDLRVAEYDSGSIVALKPGIRLGLGRDFAITGRAINIFGGGEGYRLGGSLRLDYNHEDTTSLFAIAASYPDAEADGVRQLRSVAVGFAAPVLDRVALSAASSYENREDSYRRWTGTLTLTYRFGDQ